MTLALAVTAFVAVVNPPRVWQLLPRGPQRVLATLLGAALALGMVAVAAALGSPVLDWFSISAPMARLATGIVVLMAGTWGLVGPAPTPDPALDGWRAAFVPVGVPGLLRPEVFLVALTVAADHGVTPTLAIAVPLLAVVVLLALRPVPQPGTAGGRLVDGVARFVAGLEAASGLALLMDGLYAL